MGRKPRPDLSAPPAGAAAGGTGSRWLAFLEGAAVPGPRPLRRPRLVLVLGLGALLACVGCGERRAVVSGKATVDGQPLNSRLITILFAPDKGNPLKKIPSAAVDENGNYTMSTGATGGVPLGWYKVHVHWDSKNANGQPCPVHPRFLESGLTTLSIEVVPNPQPGAYDLKFTRG